MLQHLSLLILASLSLIMATPISPINLKPTSSPLTTILSNTLPSTPLLEHQTGASHAPLPPQPWYPSDNQPKTNTVVGIVVGITIALAIVVGVLIWLRWQSKKYGKPEKKAKEPRVEVVQASLIVPAPAVMTGAAGSGGRAGGGRHH